MDGARFDRWTRRLGTAGSRRRVLAGVAALALGAAARPQPAAACDYCKVNGDNWQGCPDGCSVGQCTRPDTTVCNCYDTTSYCADAETGLVCVINQTACRNRAGRAIGCADQPDKCCGDVQCGGPYYCAHKDPDLCCWGDETACYQPGIGWGCVRGPCNCAVPCGAACCADGQTCCGQTCCAADETCANGTCRPVGCQGRGRDAGICCPSPQTACSDRCCSDGETCCQSAAGAACCPKRKQCCVGTDGVACCDPGEAFCCGGVCCAKHRVCVGTGTDLRCLADCPDDGVKCGTACCAANQICLGPETCAFCDQGETPCGTACCAVDQVCRKGKCGQCKAGQAACGTDCCSAEEHCEGGKCVRNCPKGQIACAGACCDKGLVCRDGACVKKRR